MMDIPTIREELANICQHFENIQSYQIWKEISRFRPELKEQLGNALFHTQLMQYLWAITTFKD